MNYIPSEQTLRKMSEAAKKRWKSNAYRKKLLTAQKKMGLRNYPTLYERNTQ